MRKLTIPDLHRLSLPEYRLVEKIPVVVVLDNVRSLYNVGSVFRTCDAFRVAELHLCGITGTPPNAEIHKTALGAEDAVVWRHYASTEQSLDSLLAEGYTLMAVEQCAGSVTPAEAAALGMGGKVALVFGHEVRGVGQEVVDRCKVAIEIPQYGTKHSLNVSVAAGIVLWQFLGAYPLPARRGGVR